MRTLLIFPSLYKTCADTAHNISYKQCIAQETHRSQYLHLLEVNKKSRFKHISYTERLVEWASLTGEFTSIVVILEDPEALSHRTFDAFMATMTSLRACYGVPIGLVIASIDHVGGRTALSRSSLDGIAGIDVKSFVSPPSDVVLGTPDYTFACVQRKFHLSLLFVCL